MTQGGRAYNITEDVQEESYSENMACQWHQEEKLRNQDRKYTSHKPNKSIEPAHSDCFEMCLKVLTEWHAV